MRDPKDTDLVLCPVDPESSIVFSQHCYALSDILLITQEVLIDEARLKRPCAMAEMESLEKVWDVVPDLCEALRNIAMRYDRACLVKYNGRRNQIFNDYEL